MKKYSTFLSCFVLLCSLGTLSAQNTTNSALEKGELYKMAISETGIYKVTYQQLKDNTDFNIDQINPANIQIYGNRGGTLPLLNAVKRDDDLVENSIFIQGETDGSFDAGDYILFYAEGPDRINTTKGLVKFEKNIYDLNNYYFIKLGDQQGKRITSISNETVADYSESNEKLIRHENDILNLLGSFGSTQGSGKLWFGETFTNERSQDFSSSFKINTPSNETSASIEVGFAARSSESSQIELLVNGQAAGSRNIGTVRFGSSSLESAYAARATIQATVDISSNPQISLNYIGSSKSNTEAWLDYIQLSSLERINIGSEPIAIFNSEDLSKSKSGYRLAYSGSNLEIWNVTDLDAVHSINYNSQNGSVTFGYNTNNRINNFMAFDKDAIFLSAEFIAKVENQNLHGIERADLIIVTYPDFSEAAEKLAMHRIVNDNLKVEVVDIFQIYNEFAGGKADPIAIRDMARMLKQRDDNFRYMILLGDASYDYRNIVPNLPNDNLAPTYETDQSLNPVDAYPSDDFFGLLSDGEGGDDLKGTLDLGIGRIPARTLEEANDVINKIIHYDTNPNRFGEWRTKLGFAADDVDASWDTVHLRDSDRIAEDTEDRVPCMLPQKVYFDSYKQEATPGGARYPDANKAINDNIFKGQLVFNYLGHGGPKGLSQERVVQIPDIRGWSNMDKLPVFITATCSFTGFDEPNIVSAGEHLILNPNGGAVALFTTVRSVYASQNYNLANEVFKTLFNRTEGQAMRLGDIIANSKNTGSISGTENTRKFLLIGDPCMRLALPRHDIKMTHFNDEVLTAGKQDTLGALSRGKFRGQIVSHLDSSLVTDFNGEIFVTVYDKESTRFTLVNDDQGSPLQFKVKKNILYKGTASVTNGIFELNMIMPKDIDYNFGPGSIHLYAYGCFRLLWRSYYRRIISDSDRR